MLSGKERMCLFHKWVKVTKDNNICGQCFMMPDRMSEGLAKKYPNGYCPHSIKICVKCGKFKGWGSHGRLTVIPDGCKKQIDKMRRK